MSNTRLQRSLQYHAVLNLTHLGPSRSLPADHEGLEVVLRGVREHLELHAEGLGREDRDVAGVVLLAHATNVLPV